MNYCNLYIIKFLFYTLLANGFYINIFSLKDDSAFVFDFHVGDTIRGKVSKGDTIRQRIVSEGDTIRGKVSKGDTIR